MKICSPVDEIAGVIRHLGMIAMHHDMPRHGLEGEHVGQGDLEKDRRDIVVSVAAPSMHGKSDIHLGWCLAYQHGDSIDLDPLGSRRHTHAKQRRRCPGVKLEIGIMPDETALRQRLDNDNTVRQHHLAQRLHIFILYA